MATTRWCWVSVGGGRALAFRYMDPQAGPSAKGALVGDPPTEEEIRAAVDHPNRTVRDPDAFGAVTIDGEEALRMGLPKDPPWIGFFEAKPVPPPRGEGARTIVAVVLRDGKPVAGANVRLGEVFGNARELVALDTRTTDEHGRCQFPLGRMKLIAVVAHTADAGSKIIDVPPERDIIEVPLEAFASLSGVVTRDGQRAVGHLALGPIDGGVNRVERGNADGQYRIDGIVAGTYDLEVRGIDPRTHMSAGTPTFERITLVPGQNLRKDFTLVAGTRVAVAARVDSQAHNGSIYLVAGEVAPTTNLELRALLKSLDRSQYHSANSSSSNGAVMTTEFADITPGIYTLCVECWDMMSAGHPEQGVNTMRVDVRGDRVDVRAVVPSLRPRDGASARPEPAFLAGPPRNPPAPVKAKPPPIPPPRPKKPT